MENEFYTEPSQTGVTAQSSVSSHTASDKASQMSSQVNQKVDNLAENIKSKTNKAVESTSRGIDRVTMYFKEKDSQAMMSDLQQVVRQHPGKSLISGLILGVLVGRILR